jgi:hypothetical protein
MTTVYVFRDGSRWEDKVDDGYRMALELDQAPLGFTVAKSFLVAVVSPGPHSLVSIADNRDELRFEGQPGEIVYVHQGVKYVVSNVTRLSRLDAAVAQPRIRDCRLVSTPVRR